MNTANAVKIGNLIGSVLHLGDTDCFHRARKFLRLQILVDTTKSLKTSCYLNREDDSTLWMPFRYERLSEFCY